MNPLTPVQAERLRLELDVHRQSYRDWIPADTLDGIVDYVVNCRQQGSFLAAVLCNNLMEAVGRADSRNRDCLRNLCEFLWNYCPVGCFGSRENYEFWLRERPSIPRPAAAVANGPDNQTTQESPS